MDRIKKHMFLVATIFVIVVGFYILLSPSLKPIRVAVGLLAELPGSRYNPDLNAAEIINEEYGNFYLGRIALVYHSVFVIFLYATLIIFSGLYLEKVFRDIILDLALIGTVIVASSVIIYNYFDRNFFWHGTFIAGLTIFFIIGLLILTKYKPKNLLEWNIWLSGVLLLVGSVWGAWLGSSYMHYREEFLEALVNSRFNPDLAEENIFWRALTSHEHAMIAIALTLIFLLALAIGGVKEDEKIFKVITARHLYYLSFVSQLIMALASYSVTFIGGIAHLVITPAALLLIASTLLLSFMVDKEIIRHSLLIGNIAIWIAVAIPGAIVAINLRKARFLPLAFRDPLYDWAELAYNIGHWHLLLLSWGVLLLILYIYWSENFIEKYKFMKWVVWLVLIGYFIAMVGTNLYMLANPPGEYIPNPYNNLWLSIIVEPSLIILTLCTAITYIIYLKEYGLKLLRDIISVFK